MACKKLSFYILSLLRTNIEQLKKKKQIKIINIIENKYLLLIVRCYLFKEISIKVVAFPWA